MGKTAQKLWANAKSFGCDEQGAITVDWVVLTATMIFMGIAVAFYMATTVPQMGEKVGDYMSEMTVVPD